jgi:2-hydroxyglutarate dehydrogenase
VVDFGHVVRALAEDAEAAGGRIVVGQAVREIRERGGTVRLRHARGWLRAGAVVCCAGGWATALAAGLRPDCRILPFRGSYLRLRPERRDLVRSMIYPVPDPELPFLGPHLTRHIDGEVVVGPTALLVAAPDAYGLARISPRSLRQTLTWPGTWRMGRRHWRTGFRELALAASRRRVVAQAARHVPELRRADVLPGPAGVRAQAVGRDGRLLDDFLVAESERCVHVLNAPSPAATSALPLAELIADRVESVAGPL